MHYSDLRAALRQEPFVPFRLHLKDGRVINVPDKWSMIVMRLESGVPLPNESGECDFGLTLDNDQILSLEMTPTLAVPPA